MPTRSTRTKPASTGRGRGRRCTTTCAVYRRFPALGSRPAGEGAAERARIKVLRTTKGEGTGAPGTVLDDRLTIACGEGAVRILELQRAGRQAMKADEFLRGTPVAAGTRFA